MSANPVLKWTAYAQAAGLQYGIPANVLLALIEEESGGNEGEVSSAGAGGLTQFMPGTASSYGVNVKPGGARSQIFGAAHYLKDLGYAKNPALALASYNAGPGNPGAGAGYAKAVLEKAKKYASYAKGGSAPAASSTSPASSGAASSSGGDVFNSDRRSGLLKALMFVSFVGGGAGMVWLGATHITHGQARAAA